MIGAMTGTFDGIASGWFRALMPVAIEAAIVGIVLLLVVRLGRRLPSTLRYGIMLLALVKFVAPPVPGPWSIPLPSASWMSFPDALPASPAPEAIRDRFDSTVPERGFSSNAPAAASRASAAKPAIVGGRQADPASLPTATRDAGGAAPASPVSNPGERFLLALLLSQIAAATWMLQRRARQHVRLRHFVRRSRLIRDGQTIAVLRDICREQRIRRPPEVLISPDGFGPAAAGLWRRRIFLPQQVLDRVPSGDLRPVVAHEVAHHRRGGLWVDTLLFLGSLVWWWHPMYWLVGRELRRSREACCDAAALTAARSPAAYCQSLLDIAAIVGGRPPTLATVAPGSLSHPLGRRIQDIMNGNVKATRRASLGSVLLLFVLALLATPSFTVYGATVSGAEEQEPAVPADSTPAGPAETARLGEIESQPSREARPGSEATPPQNISFSVRNGVIDLSPDAIDALVDLGLDRDFVEQIDGSRDRTMSIAELRQWVASGFDTALVDELAEFGIDSLTTMEALRLVWTEVDATYVRSLREIGYTDIDAGDIGRLARYEVTADYIGDFEAGGYDDLDVDDLVRLRRYEVEPGYAATYRQAGYDLIVDDLVRLHRYEVDEQAVSRLSAAGLSDFSVDDLVRLQRYEVGDDYVRSMTADGTYAVSVDDLVRLKRYEVTADYAEQLRVVDPGIGTDELIQLKRYEVDATMVQRLDGMGYGDLSADDLVRLQRYEVDLAYVEGLEALGYDALRVDDLVTLQRYDVDVAMLRALGESGYGRLPVGDVVRLQRYEVTDPYIRAMSAASERTFTVDELVNLKRYEVTADYVSGLAGVGFGDIDVDAIVRLKRYEVEPSFIGRLQQAGFEGLTVDEVIRLKRARR